ncbi:hypothetical protein CAPTEDRAFT_204228 [Capitella teleta]|uniref:Uncharacterized protein n=1 Tax=Capitella teleta TaxID=283909 RepID=R7U7D5_CAPTE|nr:hypothetical protein CAPTEDRAFT_204228 [Capitella teleta]|eukprot:ELT99050.1 hypothetical protein CAPTEDRAFT_204228 [Capitella teleta]
MCSEVNPQFSSTKTGVYTAIHEFIIENAAEKLNSTKKKITTQVVCQIGYLSEVSTSPFEIATKYSFGHRTLQQYLAATHLRKMDAGERKRLGYMYECRPDSKYCHFLFGLLKDEKLADAIVIIIEKMRFRPLNAFYYSCSQSHLLLYCLSELVGSSMPAKPEDAVIKNCPSNFHLSRECPLSNECFEIMFQLLASEHLKHVELVNNTVSGTRRIAELLTRIADLREQLRGLAISLVIENPDEKEQLERILKNTLFQLRLLKCYFSGEICEALRNCFPKVSLVDGLDGVRHLG